MAIKPYGTTDRAPIKKKFFTFTDAWNWAKDKNVGEAELPNRVGSYVHS